MIWPFQFYSYDLKEYGSHCECVWCADDLMSDIEVGFSYLNLSYFLYVKGPNVRYMGRDSSVPVDFHFDIWRISTESPVYIGNIPRPLTIEEKRFINKILRSPIDNEYESEFGKVKTVFNEIINCANEAHKFISDGYDDYECTSLMEEAYGWKDEYILRDIHMPIPDYTLLP